MPKSTTVAGVLLAAGAGTRYGMPKVLADDGHWLRACVSAIEIMGPEGYSREHLVEKWFRDIKVYDIFEGTGQIQRVVIGRHILGRLD